MSDFIIIGAGPAGLTSALLLHKLSGVRNITLYEGRSEIPNDLEQSYPIGINPRTLHALRLIDEKLAEEAIQNSVLVKGWQIYAGSRMVANLTSDTVYG